MLDMFSMFVAGVSFAITLVSIARGYAGLAVLNACACALNLWVALT